MDDSRTTGGILFFGLIGCAILHVVLRKFLPGLATVFLVIGGTIALAVIALVVLVVIFAFKKPKKTLEQQRESDRLGLLKKGRSELLAIRSSSMRIKNNDVRKSCDRICAVMEKILRTLKEQPEDIPKASSFMNQSLPMMSAVVRKYQTLEQSGVLTEDITNSTTAGLADLETAIYKQYENLFDNDKLDLTVELEVLSVTLKNNGLLDDDNKISK